MPLALEDALAIHAVIHSKADAVTLASGRKLPVIVSKNGARRCDYRDEGSDAVLCKFMAQSTTKQSAAATRARAGAKITHILPINEHGEHGDEASRGMIEDGELRRGCKAVGLEAAAKKSAAAGSGAGKPPAANQGRKRKAEGQAPKESGNGGKAAAPSDTADAAGRKAGGGSSASMGAYRIGNCLYRVEGLSDAELAEAVETAQRRAKTNKNMWERLLGPLDWEGAAAEKGRLSRE